MSAEDTAGRRGSAPSGSAHAAAGGALAAADRPASALPASGEAGQLALDDMLPLAIPSEARRGRGRPAGSPNIRTNKTFEVAVSRYGDPLIASVAMGTMDTRKLITELRMIASDCGLKLGASVMDVVRFQEACRAAAMPYGHGKRVAVTEQGEDALPVLVLGGAPAAAAAAGAASLEEALAARMKDVTNQTVIDGTANVSHGEKSHDDASD